MAKSLGTHEAKGGMVFRLEGNHRTLPFTLGIEGPDDTVIPLIAKGARLPCRYGQVFTTDGSFQMSAYLHLVMGERKQASNNQRLCVVRFDQGSFRMSGKARYRLDVEVTGDGRIKVDSANLDAKGGGKPIVCYDEETVTKQKVALIQRDAEEHAALDAVVNERFDFMAGVRSQINDMHEELWRMAKRKMSWSEKRGWQACRRAVYKLIEPGPENITEESLAELHRIQDEDIPKWRAVLEERATQVAAWYK